MMPQLVRSWLIKQFEKPDAADQLGLRIYEVAVPAIGDELIRLISDRRYGARRGDLCMSLVKIKHKRAAEASASLLGEDGCTRWAIECLGRLRAIRYANAVGKFLADADPDVRREAKKTLQKLGTWVEASPAPVHLVKNRRAMPRNLEEWSANLDISELDSMLAVLSRCVDQGFGPNERAEVAGVVDEMKPDQTRVFHFPIDQRANKRGGLWLVVFMDDVDSPDVEVHADSTVIRQFEAIWEDTARNA